MVELAMVLPMLTVLFIAIVDLGLVVREHQIVQNAAREGARFSSLPANWIDSRNPTATRDTIKQRVIQYLSENNINVGSGSVTVSQAYPVIMGGITSYASQVTVSYNRSLLIPGAPLLPFTEVTLTGQAVFPNLHPGGAGTG